MTFERRYLKTAKWWQIALARIFGKKHVSYQPPGTRIVNYKWKGIIYITEIVA